MFAMDQDDYAFEPILNSRKSARMRRAGGYRIMKPGRKGSRCTRWVATEAQAQGIVRHDLGEWYEGAR